MSMTDYADEVLERVENSTHMNIGTLVHELSDDLERCGECGQHDRQALATARVQRNEIRETVYALRDAGMIRQTDPGWYEVVDDE